VSHAGLQGARNGLGIGVEVLVDRGSDDDDDVLRLAYRGRVGGGREGPVLHDPRQELGRSFFLERHGSLGDEIDRPVVDVVERDLQTAVCERDPQRKAHVATATDDRDVTGESHHHI
jgi:hypothetical protein